MGGIFCMMVILWIPAGLLGVYLGRRVDRAACARGYIVSGFFLNVFSVVLFVIGTPYLFFYGITQSNSVKLHLPASQAAEILDRWGFPPAEIQDFSYRIALVGPTFIADFRMEEAEFLRWIGSLDGMSRRFKTVNQQLIWDDWDEASGNEPPIDLASWTQGMGPVAEYDREKPMPAARGYVYFDQKKDNPDHTRTLVYDLDRRRVYLLITTY